jgi:hypothetical protein
LGANAEQQVGKRAFVKADDVATPKVEKSRVVSLNFTSWNQLDGWLRQIEGLRRAA